MPSRTSLNRYGLFVSQVHKLTKDREMCKCDSEIRRKAALIAAMSSNHSWRTFEYLSEGRNLDRGAIAEETRLALDKGWMNVTERDVEEVMTLDVDEYAFSMWLFYAVSKDDRHKYKCLYDELKKEFSMGLEPIENISDY